MASFLTQVARSHCRTPTRAIWSVSAGRRLLLTSSVKHHVFRTSFGALWRRSSSATAAKAEPIHEPAQKDHLPHFDTLKGSISYPIWKAITKEPMSLTHMSPVQAEVFPLLPQLADLYDPVASNDGPPRDLLVKARTGTGKTLAFLVPAVEARLKAIAAQGKQAVRDAGLASEKHLEARAMRAFSRQYVGTLILSPTRELATQIAVEAQRLTSHLDDFEVRLFVGGESKGFQMREWMRGRRDILVSTPGRLRDFLSSEPEVVRGLTKVQLLVLDEADTLLDLGFRPDIEAIKEFLPPVPERQTFLFSATVSRAIQDIARSTLAKNHKFINCVPVDDSPVHAHVPQYHTVLHSPSQQIPHVLRLLAHDQLSNPGASKTIIFLPTYKMTQLYATAIRECSKACLPAGRNTRVFEIHSKRSMDSRTSTSNAFRADRSGASVLISSDISARGVDYPNVTRVIQVGIPAGMDQYIHRVGRTGRAGTQGRGDLVVLPFERQFVRTALSDVPLLPLTYSDLASQTTALAKKFDESPHDFFADAPTHVPTPPKLRRMGSFKVQSTGPSMFRSPVTATLEDLERNVDELRARFDGEAIKETFMSLIGYYCARTAEMRASASEVLESLKAWTVDVGGLTEPPFVSEAFLHRIGLGKPREQIKSYGLRDTRPRTQNHWEGRGRQAPWGGRGGQSGRRQSMSGQRYDRGDNWDSAIQSNFGMRHEERGGREGRKRSTFGQRNDRG